MYGRLVVAIYHVLWEKYTSDTLANESEINATLLTFDLRMVMVKEDDGMTPKTRDFTS